jgi:SAM-dependent methyltransferase
MWTDGYVSDIEYTHGFYRELSPNYLCTVTTSCGLRTPRPEEITHYCELACGQGYGLNLLAAANPGVEFYGYDFNPAQIANGRRLAAEAGLRNVHFGEDSFEQLAAATGANLPAFDVIALHGIYSWISPENRRAIIRFIEKRLKPGGIVYVSYNSLPGWAAILPLQRLLRDQAGQIPGRSDNRFAAAREFAQQMKAGGAFYFTQNPVVGSRLEQFANQDPYYLAHEYLNGHWHPMYHRDVAAEMADAKLGYACSATITENIDNFCIPEPLRALAAGAPDSAARETLKDYAINKSFRRDIYLRGASLLASMEQLERMRTTRYVLLVPPAAVSLKVMIPLGNAQLQPEVYNPIIEALRDGPKTVHDLEQLPAFAGRPFGQLSQALGMLMHLGHIHPLSVSYAADKKASEAARRLNAEVAKRAVYGDTLRYLAIPAAATATATNYVERLAYLSLSQKPRTDPGEAATLAWKIMMSNGVRLLKDGRQLETEEETAPELRERMESIFVEKVPLWRQLGML